MAVVGLAITAPARADAAWTPGVHISPGGHDTQLLGAEIGPSGDAVIGWQIYDVSPGTITARIGRSDGTLGFPRQISDDAAPPDPFSADLAMEGETAYFVWLGFDGSNNRVQFRTLTTNGAMGPVINVSQANKEATVEASVAVDSAGDAVVAWQQNRRDILVRTVSADGSMSPIQVLNPPGQYNSYPDVSVDPNGDAVIMWRSALVGLRAVQRQSDGTLGPVRDISPSTSISSQSALAPNGDAVLIYDCCFNGESGWITGRTLSAAGTLGPERKIGSSKTSYQQQPLGMDNAGRALIAWGATSGGVRARTFSTDGELGAAQTVALRGSRPDIGLDSVGNAFVGWASGNIDNPQTYVRQREMDGDLGPRQAMSGPRVGGAPLLGLNDSGEAIAAWQDGGGDGRVWISAGP